MRLSLLTMIAVVLAAVWAGQASAATGYLNYSARVVHNNRNYLSHVTGKIDLTDNSFSEEVQSSYILDWKQVPGKLLDTTAAMPDIWQSGGETCQRYAKALPRYGSPLLRHFLVGQVIGNPEAVKEGATFLSGQLVVHTAEFNDDSFEVVAAYMGEPLVVVGRRENQDGHWLVRDVAVLGAMNELYQYFIDDIEWVAQKKQGQPSPMPKLDPAQYVSFPKEGRSEVAIRPVKDWLVFQAQLPNGRPLNLIFDSGADKMILDDLVLQVDAHLDPVGEIVVNGAFSDEHMNLYEGFSFDIGGVQFHDLPVAGTMLTPLAMGAGIRIHGIVGNEILQLCQLDLDLLEGKMVLAKPEMAKEPQGEQLPITFIRDIPHVEAQVHGGGKSLLMVDTGQRSGLQLNIDYLEDNKLGEDLVMNGFLGDINGGLEPRFMIEQLDVSLGSQTYQANVVDALMKPSYEYQGLPVVGSLGFSMLAKHYGGVTFDYSRKLISLREPGEDYEFAGNPSAWTDQKNAAGTYLMASADEPPAQDGELKLPAEAVSSDLDEIADAASATMTRSAFIGSRTHAGSWLDEVGGNDDALDSVRYGAAPAAGNAASSEDSPLARVRQYLLDNFALSQEGEVPEVGAATAGGSFDGINALAAVAVRAIGLSASQLAGQGLSAKDNQGNKPGGRELGRSITRLVFPPYKTEP